MYIKLTGVILILIACGGYGITMAVSHRREVSALHQLADAMELMIRELEYRLTPLPELCRVGAEKCSGSLQYLMLSLSKNLDEQVSPDVGICMTVALKASERLPRYVTSQLLSLGQTLGRFDLAGQLTSLERCRTSCLEQLAILEHHQTQRLRSYQTLGFCAGAALAILLL